MLQNSTCNVLCSTTIPAGEDGQPGDGAFINERIQDSYNLNWLIDGLPAARIRVEPESEERFYSVGFELGSLDNAGAPILNNHYDIIVEFHVLPQFKWVGNGRMWQGINTVWWVLLSSLPVRIHISIMRE